MQNQGKKVLLPILIFAVGILVGVGAFYGSSRLGFANMPARETIVSETDVLQADTSLLWETVKVIKDKYFDIKSVTDESLLHGAIQGVVGALDDPYSSFFNPSDSKKFEEDIQGNFGGIGAEIGIRN